MASFEQSSQAGAKIYGFDSGVEIRPGEISTDVYASSLCPQIIQAYDNLGFADEFQAILGRHISDLHIVLADSPPDTSRPSRLSVETDKSSVDHKFKRLAIIDVRTDLRSKYESLSDSLENVLGIDKMQQDYRELSQVALNWALFELSADAASNSCRMQAMTDQYIDDYNGQNLYDRAELTIAHSFLKERVGDDELDESLLINEHDSLRSGIALSLLGNSLIRHNIADHWHSAALVCEDLRLNYPKAADGRQISPYSREEIVLRLSEIRPQPTRQRLAQFVASLESLEDFMLDPDEPRD